MASNFLVIIDNIQRADQDAVYISQEVTGSSQRCLALMCCVLSYIINSIFLYFSIIENLEFFSDLFNAQHNSSTFSFNTFALQLEDICPQNFDGQYFVVNLGTIEDVLSNKEEIEPDNLKVSQVMELLLKNLTASVNIPKEFVKQLDNLEIKCNERISYFVFSTNILFQTKSKSSIDSIIVSVRSRSIENATLNYPITTVMRKRNTSDIVRIYKIIFIIIIIVVFFGGVLIIC